jgi:ribonuclease HII
MRAARLICGVDEAGRGPLAGEVVAACVILHPRKRIAGLADSKQLTALQRQALSAEILDKALAWGVAQASVEEIDRINILQASLLAMSRALEQLHMEPSEVQVDGLHCPATRWPARAIVQGDALVAAISAASILAKCHRDAAMIALHEACPQYGFDRHKGYSTAEHLRALREHGPSPHHRKSFAPVRELLMQGRLF